MSLKLRELIKKVRSCKTAEDERSVINKESAEIRNLSKEQSDLLKTRSLAKCIFMHMLGYQTNFIHMTCVNLLASSKFIDKRLAYVALCVLMDEKSEVILLTSHTIKKDLESSNEYIVAAALNAIGEICTADMCRDSTMEVLKCLSSKNPYIKKKAACALTKIIKKCPEMLENVADKLNLIFDDVNNGVLLSGLALAIQVFKMDPSIIKKNKVYFSHMIRHLKKLSTTTRMQHYDINGVTDPFLQVKLLEILGHFGSIFREDNEDFNNILASISTNTDAQKNTGNAVLYELVRTIIAIDANSGLKSLGSTILGKFLGHKDNNYKYIALNTLQEVAKTDLVSVQKHKNTILECLKDNDISIKRRSLDLVYLIVNSSNIKQIITECLNFLSTAENEFKLELTSKICQSLEKYSPSLKWQIDTLVKMLCIAGNYVNEETVSSIINLVIEVTELQLYGVVKIFTVMKSHLDQEALLKVGIYLLGEFGDLLVNNPSGNPSVTENDVVELISEIASKRHNPILKEYLLNTYFKLSSKFSEGPAQHFRNLMEQETKSYYCEVQQRATEYMIFTRMANDEMKRELTKHIPNSSNKKEAEANKAIMLDEYEDEDSRDFNHLISKGNSTDRIFNGANGKKTELQKPKDKAQSINLLDTFGDIFQTMPVQNNNNTTIPNLFEIPTTISSTPVMNIPQTNDILSELGKIYSAPQTNASLAGGINSSTNTPGSIDFTSMGFPSELNQPVITTPQHQMKQIFKNNEITIFSMLNKSNDNTHVTGSFFASNNTDKQLNNVKINFSVKSSVIFKVLSTTGTYLEPRSSLGVKKEVTITNTEPEKSLVVLISYNYNIDGREVKESFKYENI